MNRRTLLATGLAATALSLPAARGLAAATEVVVQYPYGDLFNETHRQIAAAFAQTNPGITPSFRSPYKDYEDATQRVLREAITNGMPDITFQGLNRVRALVDRGVAVPLDSFIAGETGFAEAGFNETMFAAGKIGGKVYGVPFAISLPIAYYNLDLVRRAGGDPEALPKTWDEVIALARKIDALPGQTYGLVPDWAITGNWMWQSMVFANGGTMMDAAERNVAFQDAAGQQAIHTLARMVTEAKTPNLSSNDMRGAFAAGQAGILLTSTGYLNGITRQIGDRFTLKTTEFPGVDPQRSRLPAGGNIAIVTAKDPARQRAAWEVLKFWTGPIGGATMVRTTGYMAANRQVADVTLKDFYREQPNQYTAVRGLPYMTGWYAFPGPNGLKITDVINDRLQSIMDGSRAAQAEAVLQDMARDIQALVPRVG